MVCAAAISAVCFGENTVFKSGNDGYAAYRIPAIVRAADGSLVAFAEARLGGLSDTGKIDIVAKRSEDCGKTWSAQKLVVGDGANTCGNPVPILERKSGDIVLVYCWNLGEDKEHNILNKKSKDTRKIFVIRSSDCGKTWSAPADITAEVKPANATWIASGPGGGIQIDGGKFDGRLVVAVNVFTFPEKQNFAGAIFSDDFGKTWKPGKFGFCAFANESQIAQADEKTLVLNSRFHKRPIREQKSRVVSFSEDGGESWGGSFHDAELVEPICEGSLISVKREGAPRLLVFANPADPDARRNMTVRFTDAETYLKRRADSCEPACPVWKVSKVVNPDFAAYSDMEVVGGKKIGLIYESDNYGKILFEAVDIPNFK